MGFFQECGKKDGEAGKGRSHKKAGGKAAGFLRQNAGQGNRMQFRVDAATTMTTSIRENFSHRGSAAPTTRVLEILLKPNLGEVAGFLRLLIISPRRRNLWVILRGSARGLAEETVKLPAGGIEGPL